MKRIFIMCLMCVQAFMFNVFAYDCAYNFSELKFCVEKGYNEKVIIVLKDDCTMEIWGNDIQLFNGTWERVDQSSIKEIRISYESDGETINMEANLIYSIAPDYSGNLQFEYKKLVISDTEYLVCD